MARAAEFLLSVLKLAGEATVLLLYGAMTIVVIVILIALVTSPARQRRTRPYLAAFKQATAHLKYDETDDEFAYGLRFASIITHRLGGPVHLASLTGAPFDTAASRAICLKNHMADHHAPVEGCSCGFYSMKDFNTLLERIPQSRFVTYCLLHVRLSGKIIEGEHGMRSERQDVQTVWLPSTCSHGLLCKAPATRMAASRIDKRAWTSEPSTRRTNLRLQPVCESHASRYRTQLTASELAAVLQTEVVWA